MEVNGEKGCVFGGNAFGGVEKTGDKVENGDSFPWIY